MASSGVCLEFLQTLSNVLGAEYFQYDSSSRVCRLLASSERDCSGMSGPKAELVAVCLDGESTTAATTMTTTPYSTPGKYTYIK